MASVDGLVHRVGEQLGTSGWERITQEDVNAFAKATRANEWIHVDEERARAGPFGRTVAHGYLTLSLATRFVTELLSGKEGWVGVNYGLNKVRFPAPVPVGSRVRASGQLIAATPLDEGVRTTVQLTYEVEGGTKPPCVAEVVSLVVEDDGQ